MRVGINVASLSFDGDFVALPAVAARCGADGVEFPVQLWQKQCAEVASLKGLAVWSLSGLLHRTEVMPASLLMADSLWKIQFDQLRSKCEAALELGTSAFAIGIDPWSEQPPSQTRALF